MCRKKREAFQAKTILGKVSFVGGKILYFLCALAVLFTVVRVNYKNVAFGFIDVVRELPGMLIETTSVTQEQIQEVAPLDDERGTRIDASAPLDEGETWAIYMYTVGSDLKARNTNQITESAWYVVDWDAIPLQETRDDQMRADMATVVDTIMANGLDLPNFMCRFAWRGRQCPLVLHRR